MSNDEHDDREPFDFDTPAERERWNQIYERVLERCDDPWKAEQTALADMEIRRRAFPAAHGRMLYVDALQMARGALLELRSHIPEMARGMRDPAGVYPQRMKQIDEMLALIDKHTTVDQ